MPSTNEPPETRKTTLYRLHEARGHPDELRKIIVPRYLDKEGFTAEPVTVGNVPSLLVHGTISRGVTDWSAVLKKLTEAPVEETNCTAAAVLAIPVGESTYALSYGMGHLLIDPHFIDPGFGLSFAVRAVNPEKIKQVTRTAMLAQPRYERSSVPAGQNIRWYGVEEYGEIVGRITGQLADVELTFNRGRKRHISVAGTDSLKVHLATDPADLLDDLERITQVCDQESPVQELEFIARLRALKSKDPLIPQLNSAVDELLGGGTDGELALALPLACQDVEEEHQSYRVKIGPQRFATEEDLSLETILALTRPHSAGQRIKALRDGYIQLCADHEGESPLSSRIKGHLWISADIAVDTHRYFLHEGKWYEIGTAHLETIRSRIEEVLSQPPSISLPSWDPAFKDEDEYNRKAAKNDDFVLLDKKKLHTTQHPRGIEACDLLGPNIEFIHVKAPTGSSELSHLFRQALTSYDALRYDPEAAEKLAERVNHARPGMAVPAQLTVIFAIALKDKKKGQPATYRPLTADTLFTFSQVSLVHTIRMFALAQVKVEVIDISRGIDPQTSAPDR
ncbi:DUF6119 family protein [Acrocarpospora sp. B8E8]|uniref:DUF6119 family protein n=1 Tax=Acrocarpospora sp. B8E8 TaxID=3153572 RepID=UPI00325D1591